MHKCDSVQFMFRQHDSLFAASREFRGGLTACHVSFRLAVKISAALRLHLPKFGLAAIGYGLGGLLLHFYCACNSAYSTAYLVLLEDAGSAAVPLEDFETHVQYEHITRLQA